MEEEGEVSYWSVLFSSADFSDLLDNFMMVEAVSYTHLKIAGDKFDEAVVKYIRKKHNVLIGDRTAEMCIRDRH